MDRHGFPLEVECFQGDKAEKLTIVPIVEQFKTRRQLADLVVVADAGMLSAANLKDLERAKVRFIVGWRTTKAPLDLASHFRWHGTRSPMGRSSTPSPHGSPRQRRGRSMIRRLRPNQYGMSAVHTMSWRAIWAYFPPTGATRAETVGLQEERAKAVANGEKAARTPRFVTTGKDGS